MGQRGGAGGAEQRSSGARWKKEGGGEAADERARAVSGGAGERGVAKVPRGLRARVNWASGVKDWAVVESGPLGEGEGGNGLGRLLEFWAGFSFSIPLSFLVLIQTKFEFKYKFKFKPHSNN